MSAEVRERTWGFRDVGWLALWIVVCGVAAVVLTEVLGGSSDAVWADVVYAAGLLGPMTVVPLVVARRKGPGWRTAYEFRVGRRSVATGLAAGAVALVVVGLTQALVERLSGSEVTSAAAEELGSATGAGFVIVLLIGTLWAPAAEELAFRGLLWGAAIRRGWPPWVATVVAALPFSLIHVEPLRVVPLLLSGVIFGVARQRAGLAAAVIAHLTINGTAALATVIALI